MQLENLQVRDIVLHEVFRRGNDGQPLTPEYGSATEEVEHDAHDALCDRIVTAMTSTTRCVQMAITRCGPESMIARAIAMVDDDGTEYIRFSKGAADKLAEEQQSRQIPGGILVVFRGEAGVPARRLLGVIKAEVHNGFTRELYAEGSKLKYLSQLMLTAQTKLYKIGLFIEAHPHVVGEPHQRWETYIYDETLTMRNRDGAAKYFYEGFLGLGFPESSARQTKQFHEHTKSFIQGMQIEQEDKVVLLNALVTYLKADQTPTVGIDAFASAYLGDDELKDAYCDYMRGKGFPDTPVNKDITNLQSSLKTRRLSFHNKIRVSGPAEDFEKFVEIKLIDGQSDELGRTAQWTQLTIKDRISDQD